MQIEAISATKPKPVKPVVAEPGFAAALAKTSTGQAFEATVLRSFVETMLPDDAFGSGTAGHMWKGQMADALVERLAAAAGIGLARIVDGETS